MALNQAATTLAMCLEHDWQLYSSNNEKNITKTMKEAVRFHIHIAIQIIVF